MIWGVLLSVVVVMGLIYAIIKISSKFKITKSYVLKGLNSSMPKLGFKEDSIEIESINPEQMTGEEHVQDKYYYHVKAIDAQGTLHDLEGCLYDAAADYDEESFKAEQKKARPQDEGMNSSGAGLSTSNHVAGIEAAQGMLRDQAKLENEERMIEGRKRKFAVDVEITRKLNDHSEIVPKIYFFDDKKSFVLSQFPGLTLLKDVLITIDDTKKKDMLKKIARDLAYAHNNFNNVSLLVPSRRPMSAQDFRKLLRQGLKQLSKANLLTETQVNDLLNEYFLVAQWLGENFERNIRFRAFTPYEIFVNNDKALIRNWNDYDTSSEMTNLVELLKDPTTDIDIETEEEIIREYSNTRFGERKFDYVLKQYNLSSCHILTVQLCYMILYIKRKLETNVDTDVLTNWDQEHFEKLFNNALQVWSGYDESKAFAEKLREVFDSIL